MPIYLNTNQEVLYSILHLVFRWQKPGMADDCDSDSLPPSGEYNGLEAYELG
jgi:hypothetical protein